ncbi:atypical chemokine receptor 1 [Apteryx mantelli]|uniref:Atypical chemokine receptor 1 n=1 Tax=Apteryx mantelli TaxID=2696672 RepID=A0ABM4FXJ8_9AVES
MGNCIPVNPSVLGNKTSLDLMDIMENLSYSEDYFSSLDYADVEPCHNHYCPVFQRAAPVFLAVACALAALGNGALLVALAKCPHVWGQPHSKALVAQLTVGTSLFALLLPFFAAGTQHGWRLGPGLCKLAHTLWHWSLFAQGLLVASGSCSTAWSRWDPPRRWLAVAVWAGALLLATPAAFTSGTAPAPEVACVLRNVEILSPAYLAHLTLCLCLFLLLPAALAVGTLAVPWLQKGWEPASCVPWLFFGLWAPYGAGLAVDFLLHAQLLQLTCGTFEQFDFVLGLCEALGVLHCCLGPLLLLAVGLRRHWTGPGSRG